MAAKHRSRKVRLEEPRSWRAPAFFPWLACLGGLALAFGPLFGPGWNRVPGTLGDARLSMYILEHILRWAGRDPAHPSLWDLPYFFPAMNTGGYTDLMLGLAPIYGPLRGAGFSPDSAYQACFVVLSVLNFAALYRFLRDALGFPVLASSAGAFLFAFASSRTSQFEHVQMIGAFYAVASLYALVKLAQAPRLSWGWAAVFYASLALQLCTAFYPAWFFGFGLLLAASAALAFAPTRAQALGALRTQAPALAAGLLLFAAAVYPLAGHYLAAAREVGLREYRHVVPMIPLPQSWLYMGWGSWLYRWMNRVELFRSLPARTEQALGLGFVTSACCVLGFYGRWDRPWLRVCFFAALAMALLCTRFGGDWSLWRWVHDYVPGAAALRALARVGVFLLLPASIGFACFFASPRRPALLLGLLLACALEQGWRSFLVYDKQASRRDVAALAAQIVPSCPSFLFVPLGSGQVPWWKYQLDAMWASMETGVPTVNGYSGNYPPGYEDLNDIVVTDAEDAARVERGLAAWAAQNSLDPSKVCVLKLPEP